MAPLEHDSSHCTCRNRSSRRVCHIQSSISQSLDSWITILQTGTHAFLEA